MKTTPRSKSISVAYGRSATACLAIIGGLALIAPATSATTLEEALEQCADKPNPRMKYECEKEIKSTFAVTKLKKDSTKHVVGPVTFYYPGAEVEISGSSTALLNLKFLVENTGSGDNVALTCTGPVACNYTVTDGSKTYKYSAMDFTSGQTVLKPGQAKESNFMFGPAIGYGSYEDFEYDSNKQYFFKISESWGSEQIPLELD